MSKTMRFAKAATFFLVGMVAAVGWATDSDRHRTVGGIDIYIGILPAEMVQGRASIEEARMRGGVPGGKDRYHLVVALFDAV